MWGSFSRARKVQTTVCCKHCGMPLFIERSCHEVHMFCPKCGKAFPLSEYIALADEAMEPKKHGSLRSIPLVIWRFLGYKVEIL